MRKFTLNIFTLSLGLAVMPMVEAAPTAQQQLLEQVRLGEATHREDLVQQSLYRLELIDPNNPDVIAARCLLYTSPSPRDKRQSRMPSSA